MAESQGKKVNVYEKEADVTPPTSGMDKESCCDVSKENKKSEQATAGDKEPSASDVDELSDLLSKFAMRKEVGSSGEDVKPKPEQVLEELTLNGVAQYIKSGRCRKVIVMTGAGLSTAAGIPDFRSPGTGLYDNLQKYDLPSPQSVFEISYFKTNPEPFFSLAKELYPGKYKPTIGHYFIRLLADKELLLRNYTQNIDCLERKTGIDAELIVEAHGSFHTAHCLNCGKDYPQEWVKDEVFADRVPRCNSCENGGVVKPDIVFFGESLPSRFASLVTQDMHQCDLLIIMGTSLLVQPFASLVDRVRPITPRLLINKEKCNHQPDFMSLLFGIRSGLQFDSEDNYRDVAWIGTCDDGCVALADLLGWKDELLKLAESNNKLLDEESGTEISGKKAVQLKSNDGKQDKPKGNL